MKTLLAAAMIMLLSVSAFAQCSTCGVQSCMGNCYQPCATKCFQPPVVPTCYRTVDSQCLRWDLGVGRVLGYMFAPGCMPECQPCRPCATYTYATPCATYEVVRAPRATFRARSSCSSCSK